MDEVPPQDVLQDLPSPWNIPRLALNTLEAGCFEHLFVPGREEGYRSSEGALLERTGISGQG